MRTFGTRRQPDSRQRSQSVWRLHGYLWRHLAATLHATGAIALLLETQSDLTWRDVKHILAKTARQLDPDIPRVRVAFGGTPAILQHGWITNAAG